jgi:hypothetical protein
MVGVGSQARFGVSSTFPGRSNIVAVAADIPGIAGVHGEGL